LLPGSSRAIAYGSIRPGRENQGIAKARLSRRLFLLTSLALAPAVGILLYNVASTRIAKEHEIRLEAMRSGELASLEMTRVISGLQNVMATLAAAPVIQEFNADGCNSYLQRLGKSLPQFASLSVVDAGGIVRCVQDSKSLGISLNDRTYFQGAMDTGTFIVGGFMKGRLSGSNVLPLALPIRNDAGVISGAVVGGLDLNWLAARLRERDFGRNNALTVADRNGVILAREPFPEKFVGTKIPSAYLGLVNAFAPGSMEVTSQDGTNRILGYYPPSSNRAGLYVSAGISTADFYADLNRSTTISLAIAFLGVIAAYFLAWLTSTQLVRRPVNRLVATIRAWQKDDVSARTGMDERDGEFGVVGSAIDRFMDELVAARFERLRSEKQRELLVGELDHRVKNLLTTVQAVARQTFKDNVRPDEALDIFSKRLAAMSGAHQLLMKDNWQAANLTELVASAVAPFDNPGASQFSISGPDLLIHSKAALALGMAIHEMCTNAVKYGALREPAGRIRIAWSTDAEIGDTSPAFRFVWSEHDGPPVQPPESKGFGSRMIQQILAIEMAADVAVEYRNTGVVCELTAPSSDLLVSAK
jgi:two-component sensor histidine kinase